VSAATVEQFQLQLGRPPTTPDELWWVVKAMWGVEIPRVQVCPEHQAPFDAFCDAYFGNRFNWALWYGSRGTGKSYLLAILALTKAALLEIDITLLGGSMAQSQNVHEHVENLMMATNAPRQMVASSIQSELEFGPGNWIRPLPASQKTVRGPHPSMTLLDEIDEMEKKVYDAAMGQAMEKPNKRGHLVPEMVVASSTWQNPVGTFQAVKDDAEAKGMPIFTWCYREVLEPHGWMSREFIERKRSSVPAEMFRVEYELGEPAGNARAIDLSKVNEFFVVMEPVREKHSGGDDEWVFAEPEPGGAYAIGADWAKMEDKTILTVTRIDVHPRVCVYLRAVHRRPWPEMIGFYNQTMNRYHAVGAHDATGLGNVVADFVDERSLMVVMIGRDRTKLLSEYITDFENGVYRMPRNTPMFTAHKAVTVDEVWGTARWDSHLPDEVASAALMHRAAERMARPVGPQGTGRSEYNPRSHQPLRGEQEEPRVEGVVRIKDDGDEVFSATPAELIGEPPTQGVYRF
jgi:hypothetical protein